MEVITDELIERQNERWEAKLSNRLKKLSQKKLDAYLTHWKIKGNLWAVCNIENSDFVSSIEERKKYSQYYNLILCAIKEDGNTVYKRYLFTIADNDADEEEFKKYVLSIDKDAFISKDEEIVKHIPEEVYHDYASGINGVRCKKKYKDLTAYFGK